MLLRHLGYLTALARERHFARAAATCDVSQPALSAALRQLEEELGVAIVERGNRFLGFTADGESVLAWARQTLAEHEALRQRLSASAGALTGRLRLGVVPTATPRVPSLLAGFVAAHPHVVISERSMSSSEIVRELASYDLDCGITYLDGEPLERVRTLALWDERYVLVTPAEGRFESGEPATWREAAQLPLCLQERGMQNRRIVDAVFAEVDAPVSSRLETNSIYSVCGHVARGYWSSVVPDAFVTEFRDVPDVIVLPLVEPDVSKSLGLVVADRSPEPPIVTAFWEHASSLDIP